MPADIQGFLEALRLNEEARQHAIANKLAQQKADQDYEEKVNRLKLDQERHKNETEHQKAVLKATESLYHVQRLTDFQKMGSEIQKGAPVPTGLNIVKNTAPGEDTILDPSNTQDQQIPGVIGNVPLPTAMQVQQPDEFARQSAARQEVINAPAIEKANKIEAQKAKDILDRQATHDRSLAEYNALKQKEADAAALQRTIITANARIASSRINAVKSSQTQLEPQQIDDAVHGLMGLQYSGDDIRRMFPNRADSNAVFKAATDAGGVIPTKDQTAILPLFSGALQTVPLMDRFNELMRQGARNPLAHPELYREAQATQSQISEALINAANALGQRRLSDPRIKAMREAYTPLFLDSVENNTKRKVAFLKLMNEVVGDKSLGLAKPQQDVLRDNLGLNKPITLGNGKVKLAAPDGSVMEVDPKDVQHYVTRGAKVVQE